MPTSIVGNNSAAVAAAAAAAAAANTASTNNTSGTVSSAAATTATIITSGENQYVSGSMTVASSANQPIAPLSQATIMWDNATSSTVMIMTSSMGQSKLYLFFYFETNLIIFIICQQL